MAAAPLQFSVMFFAASADTLDGEKYRLVLDVARFADEHEFSSVWIPERHFATLGGLYPNPSVLHAAVAMITRRLSLRAGSVVLPLHDPLRVAEEWSVVDNLSKGRVGLSFASGWNPDDFVFFPGRYSDRSEQLFHAIPAVQELWRGDRVVRTNGIGREVEVGIQPRPVQPELPTWVTAARTPETFVRAGEIGANLLTHLLDQDLDEVARKIALYRHALARNGHDPASGIVTIMLHTFVGSEIDEAREQGRKPYCDFLKSNASLLKALATSRDHAVDLEALSPEAQDEFVNFLYDRFASTRALIGTPESCFDLAARLGAIGVNEVACLLDFGPSYDLVLRNLVHLDRLRALCTTEGFSRSVPLLGAKGCRRTLAGEPVHVGSHDPAGHELLDEVRARCGSVLSGADFYARLRDHGLQVDPRLERIRECWRKDGEALGAVEWSPADDDAGGASAALLDAGIHVSLAALPDGASSSVYLPWEIPKVELKHPLAGRLFAHAVLRGDGVGDQDEIEARLEVLGEDGERLVTVPALRLRRIQIADPADETLDAWSFELRWEPVELANAAPAPDTAFLILADEGGVGGALVRRLQAHGNQTALLERRALVSEPVTADGAEACFARVGQTVADAVEAWRDRDVRVVFLWGLDSTPTEATSVASLEVDQLVGAGAALSLMQRLGSFGHGQLPRLWLVTKGAQPVDGGSRSVAVAQSPLWGLGRTCAIEHPELWGGLVDLDPEADAERNSAHLLAALHGVEDQIAYRGGRAQAPRLTKGPRLGAAHLVLHPDGGYVISGGLKGLGYEVARWLAQKGAGRLFLLGRSPLPAPEDWDRLEPGSDEWREVAKLRSLERLGARANYTAVDIADERHLRVFADTLREQGVPVRGVVHAASVWRDPRGDTLVRPLARLDLASLREVFRPKVLGSWLLHEAFADAPLDFFLLFSSAAALAGSAGQGNYAAASIFLDTLAHHRAGGGRRALSVNFGPVSGAGFGATPEGLKVHEYWETHGLKRISVEQLLAALDRLLPQSSLPQFGLMRVDWEAVAQVFPVLRRAPWASHLVQQPQTESAIRFIDGILHLGPDERKAALVNHVAEEVAAVMGLDRLPDTQRKLFEMGMDSLMALSLKTGLETSLGTEIRVTAVFNYPTIEALSEYLLAELLPAVGPEPVAVPATAVPGPVDGALSRIQAMDDEEVDRLLRAKTSIRDVR